MIQSPVHPRASGERSGPQFAAPFVNGSSPRERGTPESGFSHARSRRFIPARAGNAPLRGVSIPYHPVHPRASGERAFTRCFHSLSSGSSPRERGTPLERPVVPPVARFIPARAGNAETPVRLRSLTAVHPRASGERLATVYRTDLHAGSSPRERGTLRKWTTSPASSRFIPARAGNAHHPSRSNSRRSVHPRASGERAIRVYRVNWTVGSSPRERGTHPVSLPNIPYVRFIPARAGNAVSPLDYPWS